MRTPIIVVPAAATSVITIWNVKEFLEECKLVVLIVTFPYSIIAYPHVTYQVHTTEHNPVRMCIKDPRIDWLFVLMKVHCIG